MNTQQSIVNYARAGYPGLYIVSHEEARAEAEVKAAAETLDYSLHDWTITQGVRDLTSAQVGGEDTKDPMTALDYFIGLPEKAVMLLKDFHPYTGPDSAPMLIRRIKDALAAGKTSNKVLVIIGCALRLAPELEKLIVVVEFKLPDRQQLGAVLDALVDTAGVSRKEIDTDAVLDGALGLTTFEAEDAFALSIIEAGNVKKDVVQREKSQCVKKSGILELVDTKVTVDDIGGLDNLKADLVAKRRCFTRAAREYGLPSPRGILVVGQPGTGKSLTATATASIFEIPLLRLEAGRLFGSLVGQSEENWRRAFATACAMKPCVLWIDEVDGLFSGMGSSGSTDGGTTQRVLKAILQDMQYNAEGIFCMFTANDVDNLPDPLVDRLETWSVDLPNTEEREAIVAIHIAKRGRKPAKFKVAEIARATDGFSGRQIEQVWLAAMLRAFNADREPTTADFLEVAKETMPTSKLMAEQIERRRKRLANRAKPASRTKAPTLTNGARKITTT